MTLYLDDSCVGVDITVGDAYRRLNYNGSSHIILPWLPNIRSIRIDQATSLLTVAFHSDEVCVVSGNQYLYEMTVLRDYVKKKMDSFGSV